MLRINRLPTIVVLVALAAAALSPGAAAEENPAPIEQYVEQVPTAQGEKPVVGKGGTVSKPLAPSARRQLGRTATTKPSSPAQREQRDAEDQILGLVAGSPNYGAPEANTRKPVSKPARRQNGDASGETGTTSAGNDGTGDAAAPGADSEGVARPVDADRAASSTPVAGEEAGGIDSPRLAAIVGILLVIAAATLAAARRRSRSRA